MANQTELLNVSDEMKLNDKKQIIEGQEHDKELYSSSEPDACGICAPYETGKAVIEQSLERKNV